MAAIRIRPGPMELGLNREGYDLIVADLRAQGHAVELVIPEERRGGVQHAAAEVIIEFLGDITSEALAAAVTAAALAVRKHVKARKDRVKHVPFFDERGHVIREIEIPPSADE